MISKRSVLMLKPVFGIGINDADYVVNSTTNGRRVVCPFYQRWCNMLGRCYNSKFHKIHPSYINCSVTTDWHYFMTFRSWMSKQDWEGMALDKDIINPNNKVYSPDNCRFITQTLNNLLNDCAIIRGGWPQGVSLCKKTRKYLAQVSANGAVKNLGHYDTPDLALSAYIKEKTNLILKAAEEQDDPLIFNGLMLHAEMLENKNG